MSAFSIKRTLELIVLNVCFPAKADIRQLTLIYCYLLITDLGNNRYDSFTVEK